METYTKYGDTYPRDSKYTDIMSDYLMGPDYDKNANDIWKLYRDFAIENNFNAEQMTFFMQSYDMGQHNMILFRAPKTMNDLVIIARKLNLI